MDYETTIKPLVDAGKTDAEVLEALNTASVSVVDTSLWTAKRLRDKFGFSVLSAWEATYKAVAAGLAPLPQATIDAIAAKLGSTPDEQVLTAFRAGLLSQFNELLYPGLDLSEQGLNDFLRQIGLTTLADLGRRTVSPWVAAGNTGDMTQADLDRLRDVYTLDLRIAYVRDKIDAARNYEAALAAMQRDREAGQSVTIPTEAQIDEALA